MVIVNRGRNTIADVKSERREGIAITRNPGGPRRDPSTNARKGPARGVKSLRTRILVRVASRGRSLPSIKAERGRFLPQMFSYIFRGFLASYTDVFFT